jgi:hypothetical protein
MFYLTLPSGLRPLSPHPMRRRESPLPTVIAWGKARFPTEELREMAGIGVAHVKGNLHHALFRFAEQSSRFIHPQRDLVA